MTPRELRTLRAAELADLRIPCQVSPESGCYEPDWTVPEPRALAMPHEDGIVFVQLTRTGLLEHVPSNAFQFLVRITPAGRQALEAHAAAPSEPPPPRKPKPASAEAPPRQDDPWSCAGCCAPGLKSAFRVKSKSYCWECFFERPQRETATYVIKKDASP